MHRHRHVAFRVLGRDIQPTAFPTKRHTPTLALIQFSVNDTDTNACTGTDTYTSTDTIHNAYTHRTVSMWGSHASFTGRDFPMSPNNRGLAPMRM